MKYDHADDFLSASESNGIHLVPNQKENCRHNLVFRRYVPLKGVIISKFSFPIIFLGLKILSGRFHHLGILFLITQLDHGYNCLRLKISSCIGDLMHIINFCKRKPSVKKHCHCPFFGFIGLIKLTSRSCSVLGFVIFIS